MHLLARYSRGEAQVHEVLVQFDEPIRSDDGVPYMACVHGRESPDRRWEGWIEFEAWRGAEGVSEAIGRCSTGVETVQPNRRDLEYWVTGLTRVYLQGALVRAMRRTPENREAASVAGFRRNGESAHQRMSARMPRAILDPFAVYAQGESVLRQELGALSADHLRSVAAAFGIASPETAMTLGGGELIDSIVGAARRRMSRPHDGELRA
jgi:hypothetical protein